MSELHRSPASGASVWSGRSFADDKSWLHVFDAEQLADMRKAVAAWKSLELHEIGQPERHLASLLPLVERTKTEIAERGFVLLRGVPVGEFSDDDSRRLYWAIGILYGSGLTQNADGDYVCPVTNTGVDFGYAGRHAENNTRGYQSNADLNFHCDPTDVVGLLCLRKAKSGGESAIVSTGAIYNEILRDRPHYMDRLARGFIYDRKNQNWPEEALVTPRIPVFARHADRVSCRYGRAYINGGAAKAGQSLDDLDFEILNFFDATARREDLAIQMAFEPGDIQLLNNFTVLHGRRAYEDHPERERRRYLLRLWLRCPEQSPWADESSVMRNAYVRFGNLGWDMAHRDQLRMPVAA